MSDNTLPNSLEAEQAVIGSLIHLEGKSEVLALIKPEHFYHATYRNIYTAIKEMAEQRLVIDLITLNDFLDRKGHLELVGGFAHLAEICRAPTAANIEAYARIISEKAMARQAMLKAGMVAKIINSQDSRSPHEKMEEVKALMSGIESSGYEAKLFNPAEVISHQLETMNHDYGDVETIFNEAITQRDLALLTGAGGTGKSYFTIKLAISIALGRPAFKGHEEFLTPTKPGVVTFLIGEDDADIYRRRLDSIIRSQGLCSEDKQTILSHVLFVSVADFDMRVVRKVQGGDLEHTEMVAQLSASLKAANTKLAVFDPMNRFCGVSENDNAEMNIFVAAMRRIAAKSSCAVLMVHHSAKGDAGGSRGASALVDGVRTHISLVTLDQMKAGIKGAKVDATDKDKLLVRMVKSNHLPFWPKPYWLERRKGGDMFTIAAPQEEGGLGRYMQVDIQAVRSAIIAFMNDFGLPIEKKALCGELSEVVKDLCPNMDKLVGVVEGMLESGLLKEVSYGGRTKKIAVNQTEQTEDPF